MKSATPELIDLLNNQREFWVCDLYTFTLVDGTVLRFTSADIDVTTGGYTYDHTGPNIKRSRTRTAIGTAVDQLDLSVAAESTHLLSGLPWMQALLNGALDGAWCDVTRAFAASPSDALLGNIVGTVHQFAGRVADARPGSLVAKVVVRSWLELLNTPLPRNLYQPPCLNTLYDVGCAVSRAAYAGYSAMASGSTRQVLNCALVNASGYFDAGEVLVTSGQNSGVKRTVRAYVPGAVTLAYPLPKPVANGDTFTIWPGCDRRKVTCTDRFGNQARFRATPHVPAPETAL